MKTRLMSRLLAMLAGAAFSNAQVKIPEAQAIKNLRAFAASYTDKVSWEKRAALLRKGILAGADLSPLPVRTPSKPVIHSVKKCDG